MNGVRPLDRTDHALLRFDRNAVAATGRIVQIGLSEIAFAAADMPLCLVKDASTGRFNLVALLGLLEPGNLFSADGRFQATYLPRAAALTGFRLDEGGVAGLAVDTADPAIGTVGDPLFEQGEPSPFLGQVRDALNHVVADVAAARSLIDRYAARRLIRRLRLSLRQEEGREHEIDGLYTLDAEALKDLADADVVALHRADALAPTAVLSASLAQVERLRQLHNARFAPRIVSYSLG